ncbi:hypothetical protein ACEWY4_022428 [Coilia grayii]|uniref:EVA1 domain-containing protein n=1 Tax=Coilia grayii TaxID=363190 RepID=A0ABD1J5Y5_9TELE
MPGDLYAVSVGDHMRESGECGTPTPPHPCTPPHPTPFFSLLAFLCPGSFMSGARHSPSLTGIPKKLLQESVPSHPAPQPPLLLPHDPNLVVQDSAPPDGTTPVTTEASPGKKETVPLSEEKSLRPSRPPNVNITALSSDMALFSSALATYTYIAEHTERAALYFVCGVCVGLFLTLFALVVQISCRTDCPRRPHPSCRSGAGSSSANRPSSRRRHSGRNGRRNHLHHHHAYSDSDTSDSDDSDWDTGSDLSARRHRRFERTLNTNVFTSAEELERAQRLEERERIIREIWMNGQPDVPGTRSLNRYY